MKAFAIATNDVRIQKGGMAMLVNALDNSSTETPHSSQDVSFAGILNRKKGTASTPAPIFNKKNPPTNDPDMTAGLIGKPAASGTSLKTKQAKDLIVLSPSEENEATPADTQKSPVSILSNEMSFPAFTDTVFTKTPNAATPAPVIALDLQEGALASTPATTEVESLFVQALPDGQVSLPSGKIWLEISLQKATKPDNRISPEIRPTENHAPAANKILNEETALQGKAPGPDQMSKTLTTLTFAMTEKTDATIMNPLALQKGGPTTPDNSADSEGMVKFPLTSAPDKMAKADTAIMNPASIQKEGPTAPGNRADSEGMVKLPLTSAPDKTAKADTAIMNPASIQKEVPTAPDNRADSERTAERGLETESADKDRMARHNPIKDARHLSESKFMDRLSNLLLQKEGGAAPEIILSQVRRAVVFIRNDNPSALSPKDAAPPSATQNPATVVSSERDNLSRSVFLDRMESAVELPDRAVTMKEETTAAGHDANIDKNRPLILGRAANSAERELFPFRAESLSTAPATETKAPISDNPAGSRTQAIINQIIDAKQAMNGDFGRIRIALSPPNLGTVDLEIVVRNERVEVVMTANNSSVQQALQSRADDIRIALQRHDLKIEAFQVLLQDQDASQSHGDALFEQRRENQATHHFRDSNAIPPSPTPVVSFVQESGPEKGRVSIFA
jgi:flagellar hook-length control protein FliK